MCSVTTTLARPGSHVPIQARVEIARHKPQLRGAPLPLVALMAERLVEHENGRGAGTVDDLARDGFTSAEILEHGPDASTLAARLVAARERRGEIDRRAA